MKTTSILILLISMLSFSFQQNEIVTQNQPSNIKHIQVKIEGMTCQVGCAKTIESKISKMKGVKYSKVSFEKGTGLFSFDSKVTSAEKIIDKINGIGGGNVYKVIESKEIKKISKKV